MLRAQRVPNSRPLDSPLVLGRPQRFGRNDVEAIRTTSVIEFAITTEQLYHGQDPRDDENFRNALFENFPEAMEIGVLTHPQLRGGLLPLLRLGVLPPPMKHWEEICTRIEALDRPPIRQWFIASVRGHQEENPKDRCKICGGNLFGYPLNQHSWRVCPIYRLLGPRELWQFLAIHYTWYCIICGEHTRSHVPSEQCRRNRPNQPRPGEPRNCLECNSPNHREWMKMCEEEDPQVILRTFKQMREEYYLKVRDMAEEGGHLYYRFLQDQPEERVSLTPQRGLFETAYVDNDRRFPTLQYEDYETYGYPGLASPSNDAAFRTPRFRITDINTFQDMERSIRSEGRVDVFERRRRSPRFQTYPNLTHSGELYVRWRPTEWRPYDPLVENAAPEFIPVALLPNGRPIPPPRAEEPGRIPIRNQLEVGRPAEPAPQQDPLAHQLNPAGPLDNQNEAALVAQEVPRGPTPLPQPDNQLGFPRGPRITRLPPDVPNADQDLLDQYIRHKREQLGPEVHLPEYDPGYHVETSEPGDSRASSPLTVDLNAGIFYISSTEPLWRKGPPSEQLQFTGSDFVKRVGMVATDTEIEYHYRMQQSWPPMDEFSRNQLAHTERTSALEMAYPVYGLRYLLDEGFGKHPYWDLDPFLHTFSDQNFMGLSRWTYEPLANTTYLIALYDRFLLTQRSIEGAADPGGQDQLEPEPQQAEEDET